MPPPASCNAKRPGSCPPVPNPDQRRSLVRDPSPRGCSWMGRGPWWWSSPAAAASCCLPAAERRTMATALLPAIRGYRILHSLGEGGMGQVFLAEDVTLERRVAIKVISQALAGEGTARSRFLREARSMAGVEHPNVVRIYAFGEAEGNLYIVME